MIYGHFNTESLKLLRQGYMVFCSHQLIYGKMHRLPFSKTARRSKEALELVSADICVLLGHHLLRIGDLFFSLLTFIPG
jgi:hypothetical protein